MAKPEIKRQDPSPPVIENVIDTINDEQIWICYYRCGQHVNARHPDCVTCQEQHALKAKTAKHYIRRQLQSGYPAPVYDIEEYGFQITGGLRGLNPKLVYRYVKFKGFAKWEYIVVGTRAEFFDKRRNSKNKCLERP